MNNFIQKYDYKIKGTLSGWDRLVFRGYLKGISYVLGMTRFLQRVGYLLKDFGKYAEAMTEQLTGISIARAENEGRPDHYIASPSMKKEDYLRSIAKSDGITQGLVAVLTCVEPYRSYDIYRNRDEKNRTRH